MTEKRFDVVYEEDDEFKNIRYWEILDKKYNGKTSNELKLCHLLNNLNDENEQLKQYKQSVSDVLLSYSQKNLSAKQLGLITAIMHELGVLE